jgi:hypothetical protein
MSTWIRPLFFTAALYDGLLGVAFVFAPLQIFALHGVEPPNHLAYVQFPALLLIVFAAMFWRIATEPSRHRDLIPYGMALKAAYVGLALWHTATHGIPSMWVPWAWADLAFFIAFAFAWWQLRATADRS